MNRISEALGAKISLIFIGERPGLGSNDSMSCYSGYECHPDKPEASWNCVSNIRGKGMPVGQAAAKVISLIEDYLEYRASGVELKRVKDTPRKHDLRRLHSL